jgi:hypothetical protein
MPLAITRSLAALAEVPSQTTNLQQLSSGLQITADDLLFPSPSEALSSLLASQAQVLSALQLERQLSLVVLAQPNLQPQSVLAVLDGGGGSVLQSSLEYDPGVLNGVSYNWGPLPLSKRQP